MLLLLCASTCSRQQGQARALHLSAPIRASNASRIASAMLIEAEAPLGSPVVCLLINRENDMN
jgi:hypothetical protein